MTPVVIEAALSSVTKKALNPHVPVTPAEITADVLGCLTVGAGVVHNHVDDFHLAGHRAADRYMEGWRPVLAERPDAILYSTGCFADTVETRLAHLGLLAEAGATRMGFLDPGSVNVADSGAGGMPGSHRFIYTNSYEDIDLAVRVLDKHRLGPAIAIYEPGFLRLTLAYHRAGRLPPGAMIKFYFTGAYNALDGVQGGFVPFGLPATAKALDAYLEMMEGCDLPWAVAVLGGDVVSCGMARLALERGGHLRVGLEDFAGPRAPSNAELVAEAAALARAVGRPVADCATTARLLNLPRG